VSAILKEIENTPSEVETWDKPIHWHFWEKVRKWEQSKDISNHKYCLELDQLIAMEIQVFRHP
jgi:hypothetical protein